MATNQLTCCERLDESKYWHKCACPSATFTCESEAINPELCGFEETSGYASTPPRMYLVQSVFDTRGSGPGDCPDPPGNCCGDFYWSGTTTRVFTPSSSGCGSRVITTGKIQKYYQDGVPYQTFDAGPFPCNAAATCGPTFINWLDPPPCRRQVDATLSFEDTELDAVDRATPTAGTLCSSIWETRSTGFTFVKRTSEYTIECADLVVGYEYEVIPSIRRRTVVIFSYGAWEDVTVASETFTATAKTKTFAAVALNHIQGYEYVITGVTIEKTA